MNKEITIFAGPCAVESYEQFEQVARCVSSCGLTWIRGGAFKPRMRPESFQGLGLEGLKIMREIADMYHLKVISEVIESDQCALMDAYVDGFQIGTRNMTNYALLKSVGAFTAQSQKLVMLKRGMAATIEEWLTAVDYITQAGNNNVILCERGIRTFETATRFTLDISAVPVVHKLSNLPVCVDVSHPAGIRDYVPDLACAATAVGADAIMIEVHPNPHVALSDGPQQLNCKQFVSLVDDLKVLSSVQAKTII